MSFSSSAKFDCSPVLAGALKAVVLVTLTLISLKHSNIMASDDPLAHIPEADIDPSGTFKYVLIRVQQGDASKYLVRGHEWAEYHDDIFQHTKRNTKGEDLVLACVGGGRIAHDPDVKSIKVYGYSMGYGRADHAKAVAILKRHYPAYDDITFSNDGY